MTLAMHAPSLRDSPYSDEVACTFGTEGGEAAGWQIGDTPENAERVPCETSDIFSRRRSNFHPRCPLVNSKRVSRSASSESSKASRPPSPQLQHAHRRLRMWIVRRPAHRRTWYWITLYST